MENVNWQAYYKPQDYAGIQGNPALDDLRQRIHQRQAQKTQENADFTKEISKLNFNGARDAQLPELHSQYGDILKTFADLRNTNDPKLRQEKSLQLQQQQNQFLYNIEDSKEKGKKEQALIDISHHPNAELADGAMQNILGLTKKTGKDWDAAYNDVSSNLFAPKWDSFKESSDIAKSLTKDAKPIETSHVDKATGEMIRTTSTPQVLDKDAFISAYVNRATGHPAAVKLAQEQTGESDPAKAVVMQAQQLYAMHQSGLKDKVVDKNTGETIAAKEQLARYSARQHQIYSTSTANQVTPFQQTATQLQSVAQTNPAAANDIVKSMVEHIPTKGLHGDIKYSINNGTLAIDMPNKRVGNSFVKGHPIRIDIADPHFTDVLQAKLHQEGVDVNGYNQAFKGKQMPDASQKEPTYKAVNGKQYSHKELLKAGYTEEQIKQAIKLGNLK